MSVLMQSLDKPIVVAFGGRAGCGKTTIANIVAPLLGPLHPALWLNTDAVRKELAGIPWSIRLLASHYTPEARDRIYLAIESRASLALQEDRSIIWDASFQRLEDRKLACRLSARHAMPFIGLYFDAPVEVRRERVRHRTKTASDADENYVINVERAEIPDEAEYKWFTIDSSGSIENTTAAVVERISKFLNDGIQPKNE